MLLLKNLQWLLIIYTIEPRLFCMTQEALLHLFSTKFYYFSLQFCYFPVLQFFLFFFFLKINV